MVLNYWDEPSFVVSEIGRKRRKEESLSNGGRFLRHGKVEGWFKNEKVVRGLSEQDGIEDSRSTEQC